MSVSKRTRFEVLRRDNHTCRYCGGAAPDVTLTVDHVTPVALGGTDDPSNLVAACRDCNAGKSSSAPDASLVADVREDAMRHAELIRQAYAVLVERMGFREDYVDEVLDAYTYEPLPDGHRQSIGRWFEMGIPVEIVVDAAEKACAKARTFRGSERFTYMCGIVWNQARAVDEMAATHAAIAGSFMTDDALTNERIAAYEKGNDHAISRFKLTDVPHRLLSNVIEGSSADWRRVYDQWWSEAAA